MSGAGGGLFGREHSAHSFEPTTSMHITPAGALHTGALDWCNIFTGPPPVDFLIQYVLGGGALQSSRSSQNHLRMSQERAFLEISMKPALRVSGAIPGFSSKQ
jgi:hypothetical protein